MILALTMFLVYAAGALDLPLYEGETVFFTDVLLSMTREMVKEVESMYPILLGVGMKLTV